MQKITYENYLNGLSISFSNDNPRMFLAGFDGNSAGATAITYKPAEFDGERFVSANLDARTVTFAAEWSVISGGKYSVKGALRKWEEIQRVFVPGNMGKLTWTNGSKTRFIECRTEATPNFSYKLPFVLHAEFALIADYPYWQDTTENVFNFGENPSLRDQITVTNNCGIAVPFIFTCSQGWPALFGLSADKVISLLGDAPSGLVVVDTRNCTVTVNGVLCNQYLNAQSEFFGLLPGDNLFRIMNMNTGTLRNCVMRWRDHYLGVNC